MCELQKWGMATFSPQCLPHGSTTCEATYMCFAYLAVPKLMAIE